MRGAKRPHETPWWRLPECTGMNRLPGRSLLLPVEEEPVSLNGDWSFRLYDSPEAIPEDALQPAYREKGMQRVSVPGDWSSSGVLKPNYLRSRPPFVQNADAGDISPPDLPDNNPTGLYRRSFTLASYRRGRRYVLHLAGVESAAAVYVNGSLAGYGKDSSTPLEFDISSYVSKGENQLSVVVPRYCDGSYLESSDRWWFGGIYREVFVYSTSAVHISDVRVTALPTADLRSCEYGLLVDVGFPGNFEAGYTVESRLVNPDGSELREAALQGAVDMPSGRLKLGTQLQNIDLWSAETPTLYSAELSLKTPAGEALHTVRIPVGFRRIAIEDGRFLLNAKPLMLHGVNRDEHDRNSGRTLSRSAMEHEIALMKRLSINAVRTTNRPQDPYWYELCDRYGIYVVDEPALAAGAFGERFSESTRWSSQILDRTIHTVLRDKNHPSVIVWSLGAASGTGPNHQAAAAWIRSYDPTRPLMYEGDVQPDSAVAEIESAAQGSAPTIGDFITPSHPSIEDLEHLLESGSPLQRPVLAAAYSGAMGNSNGSLDEYYHLFEKHDSLQGGFITGWMDRTLSGRLGAGSVVTRASLRAPEANKAASVPAYGGDFGDQPHDGNFCINGIISSDLTPKPAALELAHLARCFNIEFSNKREQVFRVTNRRSFSDLSDIQFSWQLLGDGRQLQQGRLNRLHTAPGESDSVKIEFDTAEAAAYEEVLLTVRAHTTGDLHVGESGLVPGGTEIASVQFHVRAARGASPVSGRNAGALSLKQDEHRIWIRNDRLRVTFQKEPGIISSVFWDEQDILLHGPKMQLHRPQTDNDRYGTETQGATRQPLQGASSPGTASQGSTMDYRSLQMMAERPELDELEDGSIRVRIHHYLPGLPQERAVEHHHEYLVHTSGDIYSRHVFVIGEENPAPLRVGVRCELKTGYNQVSWYGRGPHENYADRKSSAHIGRYIGTPQELSTPYIRPQENGARTDVLWAAIEEPGKSGLLLHMPDLSVWSALPYRPEDIDRAEHDYELQPREETVVIVDCAHAGVGTGALGPTTREAYRTSTGRYRCELRMRPYRTGEEDPALLARQTRENRWSRDFNWD
ncbi:MAG: DUF4981 domain-containing protein [Spirochaetaceae bacterium]|nr:MAG: DUF4981 domain-containing protein [Spirochaetaceae bacterium]